MKSLLHPDSVTRILVTAFGAVLFLAIATPVAQHFHYDLAPAAQWVICALGAGVAFFSTSSVRGAADFVNDCMQIPTAGGSPLPSPVTPRPQGITLAEETGNQTVVLEKDGQPDGSIRVKVTSNGLSKREFNALRTRLENPKLLPNVKWTRPVNLKNGKRLMEGTLAAGPAQATTLRKLDELTGRRV